MQRGRGDRRTHRRGPSWTDGYNKSVIAQIRHGFQRYVGGVAWPIRCKTNMWTAPPAKGFGAILTLRSDAVHMSGPLTRRRPAFAPPEQSRGLTTSTRNWPDAVTDFAGTPTTATFMFAAIVLGSASWMTGASGGSRQKQPNQENTYSPDRIPQRSRARAAGSGASRLSSLHLGHRLLPSGRRPGRRIQEQIGLSTKYGLL